jgi:hypothetical protein
MKTYKWHELYNAAVLETNWTQIESRIQAAEAAISGRLQEFGLDHGGTPEENQAIVDALDRLKRLRSDVTFWRQSKENN